MSASKKSVHSFAAIALAFAGFALSSGCTHTAAPVPTPVVVVLVLVRLPAGTSLERVDDGVGEVAMQTAQKVAGAQAVETVARAEELEVYVRVQSEKPVEAVRRVFEGSALGPEAKMEFATLSGPMPNVVPSVKPVMSVTIDPQKAAALGISQEEIDKAVGQANAQSTTEAISAMQVKTANGQAIRLSDVARVTIEARPDCVVDRWP